MKLLFCIRSHWFFKNVEPQLREALHRGHVVVLWITTTAPVKVTERDRLGSLDVEAAIDEMKQRYPTFSIIQLPERADRWMPLVDEVRRALDLTHLLDGRFDSKPRLRQRAIDRAHPTMASYALRASRLGKLDSLRELLRAADRRIPPETKLIDLLKEMAPDVLAVTPLVALGCNQNEIVRAAEALRIPTVFNVHSWDNLSMKSPLRCWPTRMVVWNEVQRREALDYHDYPQDRVEISGAPHFDDWYQRRPSRSRQAFLADLGLDPASPLITYLCSTVFDFQKLREQDFVKRWAKILRESGHEVLQRAAILVRVHPQRVHIADQFLCPEDEKMIVWPRKTTAPVGEAAKDAYVSSLAYADAVVGINTTGMVEAAYLGTPVLTILGTEFSDSQDGTFHFGYLTNAGAGMIRPAFSMEEHLDQLVTVLSGAAPFTEAEAAYVRMFVRPQGEQASSVRFVDIMEQTAGLVSVQRLASGKIARAPLVKVVLGVTALQAVNRTKWLARLVWKKIIAILQRLKGGRWSRMLRSRALLLGPRARRMRKLSMGTEASRAAMDGADVLPADDGKTPLAQTHAVSSSDQRGQAERHDRPRSPG